MKHIARALALTLALLPVVAAAQQFPTVPDHSVIGRIGIGGSSGPSQAIPFATLFKINGTPIGPQSCSSHNWFNTLGAAGTLGCSQPAVSDISGFGTGVATALALSINTAGGLTVPTAALTLNGVVYGGGSGATPATATAGTNGQLLLGVTGSPPQMASLSQDCTVTNAGVITCTKTNNVSFGTAATVNTGTSGATIPLNNGNNTFSGTENFTSTFQINGNAQTFPAAAATLTQTIASGAKALATGAIGSAACTSAQTATATGTLTTDAIIAAFNGDPTAVTGYVPLTTGMLTIIVYPTADTVNFKACNNTASSITPGAVTINWRVVR